MKPISTVVLLAAVLAWMWSMQVLRIMDLNQDGRPVCEPITMDRIQNVQLGMSSEAVQNVMETKPSVYEPYSGIVRWNRHGAFAVYQDREGGYLSLQFNDDKLRLISYRLSARRLSVADANSRAH